jgi:pantetheine-phosphate adenylyltransferase
MSETVALYPGTFDCLTFGHIDLIERCARLFDHLIVAVAVNTDKRPVFSIDERLEMLRIATADMPNVEVTHFTGLTALNAQQRGIKFMIRGLRAVTDFEYELQMALMNQRLAPGVETIFMTPSIGHAFVSSSLTKEIVAGGADASSIIPPYVEERLRRKLAEEKQS